MDDGALDDFDESLLLFQQEAEEFLWDSKRRELKSRLLKSMMIYILLEIMEYLTDSNRLQKNIVLTQNTEWERKFPLSLYMEGFHELKKKAVLAYFGILSPQEQEHKLLQKMKIRSLQIEYQSWWKKEQLSGLKINFHKSKLFYYGAAKGSLAMFMFSFFETH
ncbi:hypothetical protein ACJX0J_037794 [Zea mays]